MNLVQCSDVTLRDEICTNLSEVQLVHKVLALKVAHDLNLAVTVKMN
jgi:hypothetical protein